MRQRMAGITLPLPWDYQSEVQRPAIEVLFQSCVLLTESKDISIAKNGTANTGRDWSYFCDLLDEHFSVNSPICQANTSVNSPIC